MPSVTAYPFSRSGLAKLETHASGRNWPVVYVLENSKEAYIGETTSAVRRVGDHLDNPVRSRFDHLYLIEDSTFNKSATLDLEAMLIEYIAADEKYQLQNSNRGLRNHNYYNKETYKKLFRRIWDELLQAKVAQKSIRDIENSDLFKYSPFKSLTDEQADIVDALEKTVRTSGDSVNIIKGEPGSGKTILAIYLVKFLLSDTKRPPLKVGIVFPQTSLRGTVKKIFSHVRGGLKTSMVLGPNGVVNEEKTFDVLVVDEAHRLAQRRNLANYSTFDTACAKLGLDPLESTQLDWMLKKAKHVVFLYDDRQSVKPSDVDKSAFDMLRKKSTNFVLTTQMRVMAGSAYPTYVQSLFDSREMLPVSFPDYDFKLFLSLKDLVDRIRGLDAIYGLCRVVAGYAWDWASREDPRKFDIEIQGLKLRWNSTVEDWINSRNSLHEVGCIHTVQGYDLNYVGVIIGPELTFERDAIVFHPDRYKDRYGKHSSLSRSEQKSYVVNIYKTLMTRGIKGTFVYAYDEGLREHLSRFIPSNQTQAEEIAADPHQGYVADKRP